MILIDTNTLVYIAQGRVPDSDWQTPTPKAYSLISKLETLGYHKLPTGEMHRLNQMFGSMQSLPITDEIIERAIGIRQLRKISLGDSVIAATGLTHDLKLWTNDTKDFSGIESLKLYNPLTR